MQKYREELRAFVDALYVDQQKVLVYGEGKPGSALMLIGEAPGEQESLQGRPFVGKAGKNLDEFLELSGIPRADVYITNVVKFRPVRQGATRLVNRAPTREEVLLFRPWLLREIEMVAPRCVVTMGNVALRAITGKAIAIGQAHGTWAQAGGLPLYPLYHPASVIYNRELRDVYLADVRRLSQEWEQRCKPSAP